MSAIVNTVLGSINADQLGKTLIHEHFVFGYPGFEGDSTLGEILAKWHPTHIFEDVIPELKMAGVTEEQINRILIENPKRLFGG